MVSDDAHPHRSGSDTPESSLRFGMMLAELWHDWFGTMSQVAYQTHKACEFFVENGGPSNGQHGPFEYRSSRGPFQAPDGAIDMDELNKCLQSMGPMQAARVVHAVRMMQAMEAMLKRRRSRADEPEGAAW
jgi:hypothetical protein